MLSPSILDHLINNDRKLPPEYNLPHTYVEMQVSGWPADGTGWKKTLVVYVSITSKDQYGTFSNDSLFIGHFNNSVCTHSLSV